MKTGEVEDESPKQDITTKDKASFKQLFLDHYATLVDQACFILEDRSLSDEAVSDVFISIWKKRHEYSHVGDWAPYLRVAVKRHCIRLKKKEVQAQQLKDNVCIGDAYTLSFDTPESKLLDKELHRIISNAVARLPLRRGLVFKMVKEEGLSYKEVADSLEISVKTVEMHVGMALKEVRKSIHFYQNTETSQLSDSELTLAILVVFGNLL